MKRLALSIVLVCFAIISMCAQITIGKVSEDKQDTEQTTPPYDSLKNICAENVMSMRGQTLFVYGNEYQKEEGFYRCFFTTKHSESDGYGRGTQYMETKKQGYSSYYTPFEAVAGKYYLIKDVFLNQYKDYGGKEQKEYNLLLEDVESKENIYFYYSTYFAHSSFSGCLILGFYEKLKELYVGKTFVVLENTTFNEYGSNNKLDVTEGMVFECSDIAVNIGEYNAVYAVLSNAKLGKVRSIIWGNAAKVMEVNKYNSLVKKYGESNAKLIAKRIKKEGDTKEQMVMDLWESLVKNYGGSNAKLIIEGKVAIGMTEEMAIESWGKPDYINTTKGSFGVHEQWVYKGHFSDKYLYFENGRLTTIQN